MNKIGIKIDLSTFFDDERKMVFVMVDPNWENVECLQKRVEFLFDVDSVRFVNSDGFFLPPQESIEIVKFCSGLKAFVPKDSLEKRKKKHSKKSKCPNGESETLEREKNLYEKNQEDDDSKKKRKYCSLDNDQNASPNTSLAKRLKNCVPANENLSKINKSAEITSTSEQMPTFLAQPGTLDVATSNKSSKSKKSKASTTHLNHGTTDIGVEYNLKGSDELKTTWSKEMNKETKKLHTSTPKVTVETENGHEKSFNNDLKSCVERVSSIPSSTFLNESKMMGQKNSNNPFKQQSSGKGHIYFNQAGEIVSTKTKKQSKVANSISKKNKTVVVFRCPLQDVAITPNPRIFQIKRHSTDNEKRKSVLEIRENLILPPIPNLNVEVKNLSVDGLATTELSNKEKSIETEQSALNNTSFTETSTNAKNDKLASDGNVKSSQIGNSTEVSPSKQKETSKLQSDSINATSESNCIDMSIGLEGGEMSKSSEKDFDTSSEVEEVSEIIDLNETEDNCNSTANESISSPSLDDIQVDKILPYCSAVLDMPSINDIIIFKMAYNDGKKRYGVTKYLAGRVEYINRRTKAIKMLIVDGLAELCHIPSHCITNLDNSQDNIRYLQVKMNDMIEPKVYSVP